MGLAISQSLLLVMSRPQKRFLAFGTDEMLQRTERIHDFLLYFVQYFVQYLDMPMFPESSDDSFFDRSSTCATNWDAHLVVTSQTVQLPSHFARFRIQLHTAIGNGLHSFIHSVMLFLPAILAIVMVWMVCFSLELDVSLINDGMTLVTHILPQSRRLLLRIAFTTQRPAGVSKEADVGQLRAAQFASEAFRMPTTIHRFDHASDDEFSCNH